MNKNSNIFKILKLAIENNASDIHIGDRYKPTLRVHGELKALEEFPVCTPEIMREFTEAVLTRENLEAYYQRKDIDASLEYGGSRFRVHIFRDRGSDAFSFRLIPKEIPLFSKLDLPPVIKTFANKQNGLVLVTGVTGSGKSTTLAGLIGEINRNSSKHIITVEDPIEFVHEHDQCIINQREVGTDVLGFASAVRAAMREDPDILLVGELRDVETIANAITMAETGHLVFGTLHTKSVAETVDRMIDVFPPEQQEQIRIQLANSLEGVITQELVPKLNGGRVACCEIMIVNDAIRNLIREQASPNAILDQVAMNSKKTGSQTKAQALAKLVTSRKISKETALERIPDNEKESFNRLIQAEI